MGAAGEVARAIGDSSPATNHDAGLEAILEGAQRAGLVEVSTEDDEQIIKVKEHPVTSADLNDDPDEIWIMSNATGFQLSRIGGLSEHDRVWESDDYGRSEIYDHFSPRQEDGVFTSVHSPSQPPSTIWLHDDGLGDDSFIDVEIYVP